MPITAINADDGSDDYDPRIPDPDVSLYVILDTGSLLYHERLRPFSNDLDEYSGFFIPRLNNEGTRCLLQIKVNQDAYPWLTASLDPGVVGTGNKDWAIAQMDTAMDEWDNSYNDWTVHRDFLTGKTDAVLYEAQLEEGRASLNAAVPKRR